MAITRDSMPKCTKEYWPSQGGRMADTIESEGMPGDKDGAGVSVVTGNTEEGEYNHDKIKAWGDWPHSPADPEVGGPPLASTDGGPSHADVPVVHNDMNDRVNKGY